MTAPTCRFCGAALTRTFVDLGATPLANAYRDPADTREEPLYPLHVRVCDYCLLVQVEAAVPAEAIFSDYAYFSSYARSWVEHARRYAMVAKDRLNLGSDSLVIEVASNDGYLLRHFVEMGVPVLGIEPAANVAAVAEQSGVPTRIAFFGRALGEALAAEGKRADLTAANNVLAHVPDLNDFVGGFAAVLKPTGVATFEFPHLLRLIEGVQFDTIYHEHFSYFSLHTVERVLAAQRLRVFDVEELPTHGGSLRLWVCHAGASRDEAPSLANISAAEHAAGIDRIAGYAGFSGRVATVRDGLRAFLARACAAGERVAAYGAAAKGNTLLNVCGIDAADILWVADANPHKQGHLLPGSRIPVVSPERLRQDRPDWVLILPWNLRREIATDHAYVHDWGGRFVVAVPTVAVVA
ncbi:MAG: methyltransferase domain-containing protein [Alphaproteobacteria bacterium]|nr:methyltransferase domain-containing protein [Alphaproteobacteria bacterium]